MNFIGRIFGAGRINRPANRDFKPEDLPDTRVRLFFDTLKIRWSSMVGLNLLYLVIWLVRSIMEPKLMAQSAGLPPLPALMAMYVGFCAMGVAGMILGPILLLLMKQLHDGGYLHLWK